MKSATINTYHRIFLIKFHAQTVGHITTPEGIAIIFKENPEAVKRGIEFIKHSDTTIPKFKRASKKDLKNWLGYYTESILLIEKTSYLK